MLEYFFYEKNDIYNLFEEEDLKIRKKIAKPLFIQKFSWMLLLSIYFIYIYAFNYNQNILQIGLITICIVLGFNLVSIIFKTYEVTKIEADPDNEGRKALYNVMVFKKWYSLIFQGLMILSIYNYINGDKSYGNLIIILLIINIVRLLLKLGINKFRMSLIKFSLENIIEEVENLEKEIIEFDEYIEAGEQIEVLFGTRYSVTVKEVNKLLKKVLECTLKEKNSLYSKSQLVSNLSHDLKTPLTSIINSVYILKHDNLDENEKLEQIKILEEKTIRLKTLIENLNEVIMSEENEIILNKENLDLSILIEDCINSFKQKLEEANLNIKINRPEDDVIAFLDKDKTIRIFENLISNIIKYSLEDTRVYVDIIKEEESIKVTLKNISKFELEVDKNTLGNRFVKGDKSRHNDGYGLGLSIVKNLVRVQGGKVDIFVEGDLFKVEINFKNKSTTLFMD